jgi:hypothetical protein
VAQLHEEYLPVLLEVSQLFCEGLDAVRTFLRWEADHQSSGNPLQLFALMWSTPDVIGLFTNNVVSFSRKLVLRGPVVFT